MIYLLVTLTASRVVDPGTLSESSGPLLEVVRAVLLIAVGIVLWGINRVATDRVTRINAEELQD